MTRTLVENDLLDELRLWVHPVLVGTGEPGDMLFGELATTKLDLIDVKTLGSGVALLTYGRHTPS